MISQNPRSATLERSVCLDRTSFVHFGEGDVSPAWQALRKVASKTSILFGKNTVPPAKKLEEKIALKTIYFNGKSFPPSSKKTKGKCYSKTTIFRSECIPPPFRGKENFFKVLLEPSTEDVGKEEDEVKNKEEYEVEDMSESVAYKEDYSEYSDDLEEDYTENEPDSIQQKSLELEEPDVQPPKSNLGQIDQKDVITCPWKKLAIILFIFSLVVLTILINSQTPLNSDLFENLTGDLTTFLNGFWKEPEPVKEFPSFLERCRRIIGRRKEVGGLVEMLSKIDIVGVLAIGFVIFVLIP